MTTNMNCLNIIFRAGLLAILMQIASFAEADCVTDLTGEVYCGGGRCIVDSNGKAWCSRYYDGAAAMTLDGEVLCGKGQCAKDSHGQVFCSSEVGGAVLKDSRGRIRCYGKCEPASAEECESTRADSAGG